MSRIVLIADDEMLKLMTLEEQLRAAGFDVLTATDGDRAANLLHAKRIDALVTDVRMPGTDGLSLLERSKALDRTRPVLVMTGYAAVDDAVRAMRAGAIDYMIKPVSGEEVVLRLQRAFAVIDMSDENRRLRGELQRLGGPREVVYRSPKMAAVLSLLERAASTEATVLIVGETGTGKEVCAQHLHDRSSRRDGPFVPVSCAALATTLIESELFGHERGAFTGATVKRDGRLHAARGGTLFLDDVDDFPIESQAKLLQVLQRSTYERVGSTTPIQSNVRWVAATKRSLSELVAEGRFRDDLMYRLEVVEVVLPPLRERPEDVAPLAEYFLRRSIERMGRPARQFTPAALERLAAMPWPGNVRELEHVIESIVVLHTKSEIDARDIPIRHGRATAEPLFHLNLDTVDTVDLDGALHRMERDLLTWALEQSGGNQVGAARRLRLARSTFQYRWSRINKHLGDA